MAAVRKQNKSHLFEVTFESRFPVTRRFASELVTGSLFVLVGYKKVPKEIKSLLFKEAFEEVVAWPDEVLRSLAGLLLAQITKKPMQDVYTFMDNVNGDCVASDYVGAIISTNMVREYVSYLPDDAITRLVNRAKTKAVMEHDIEARKAICLLEGKGYKVTAVQR